MPGSPFEHYSSAKLLRRLLRLDLCMGKNLQTHPPNCAGRAAQGLRRTWPGIELQPPRHMVRMLAFFEALSTTGQSDSRFRCQTPATGNIRWFGASKIADGKLSGR